MRLLLLFFPLAIVLPRAGAQPVDSVLQRRIDLAIDSGVAYLMRPDQALAAEPSRRSYPLGADGLVYYTLLTCGVTPTRPELTELEERVARAPYLVDQTYSLAVTLLGLLKTDSDDHRAAIALVVARLEAGQLGAGNGKGAWGYDLPEGTTVAPGSSATSKQKLPGGHWDSPPGWWDNSNTQYAVLALRAAVDHGFPVSERVFQHAAEHLLRQQDATGGFGYGPSIRADAYSSMTAGALGALAMCADVLDTKQYAELHRRIERAQAAGAKWLGRHLRWPPADSGWPYYAAYAVERLGHYTHAAKFGEREWYADGARWLVEQQDAGGAFGAGGGFDGRTVSGSVVDTCFALLFLKKASVIHTQESDEILVILRSLDAQAPESAVARVRDRILEVGKPALNQLVKALYLDNATARRVADECLRTLTGEDFGLAAATDDAELRTARERWVRWVLAHPSTKPD